ncbi:MAG: hypothetical protein ACI865_002457 [Flavobacteriaceae bacterium]|jgi:hypothetical protein
MKSIIITLSLFGFSLLGISQTSTAICGPEFAPGGCYGGEVLTCGTVDDPTFRFNNFSRRNLMTIGLTTANMTSIGFSSLMLINGKQSNLPYYIGIGTGLAQTTYGVMSTIQSGRYMIRPSHLGNSRFGKVNIGIGAVTTLFNTFGLVRNIQKKRNSNLSVNLFSFQEEDQGASMGFTLIKKF